jgi:hypothetical protein
MCSGRVGVGAPQTKTREDDVERRESSARVDRASSNVHVRARWRWTARRRDEDEVVRG